MSQQDADCIQISSTIQEVNRLCSTQLFHPVPSKGKPRLGGPIFDQPVEIAVSELRDFLKRTPQKNSELT
jgi:hypothetical protein